MATYLDNQTYARFRGNEDLATIADQFHDTLDAGLPQTDPGVTEHLGGAAPSEDSAVPASAAAPSAPLAVAPQPDSPPPSVAAASTLPAPDAPVTAPLAAPPLAPDAPVTAPLTRPIGNPPAAGDFQSALDWGNAQIGKPYIWGSAGGRTDLSGTAPGYDCSGFVSQFYHQMGRSVPAQTLSAYHATTHVDATDARPGDIVEWMDPNHDATQEHMAIYLGNGKILQSGGVEHKVNIGNINQFGSGAFEFRRAAGAPADATDTTAARRVAATAADVPGAPSTDTVSGGAAAGPSVDLQSIADAFHAKLNDTASAAGQAKDTAGQSLADIANAFHARLDQAVQGGQDKLAGKGIQLGTPEVLPAEPTPANIATGAQDLAQNGPIGAARAGLEAVGQSGPVQAAQQLKAEAFPSILDPNHPINILSDPNATPEQKQAAYANLSVGAAMGPGGAPAKSGAEILSGALDSLKAYPEDLAKPLADWAAQAQGEGQAASSIGVTIQRWMEQNPVPKSAETAAATEATPAVSSAAAHPTAALPAAPTAAVNDTLAAFHPEASPAAYPTAAAPPPAGPPADALPAALAKSSPNYAIGPNQFKLEFASDTDKALFIVAQKNLSKADEKFMEFLRGQFPSASDAEIRQMGTSVRSEIKTAAQAGDPSVPLQIKPSQTVADAHPTASAPPPPATVDIAGVSARLKEIGQQVPGYTPPVPEWQRISQKYVDLAHAEPTINDTAAARRTANAAQNYPATISPDTMPTGGRKAPWSPPFAEAGNAMPSAQGGPIGPDLAAAVLPNKAGLTQDAMQIAYQRIEKSLGAGTPESEAAITKLDTIAQTGTPDQAARFLTTEVEGKGVSVPSVIRTFRTGSIAGGLATEAKVLLSPFVQVAMRAPEGIITALRTGNAANIPKGFMGGFSGLMDASAEALQTVRYGTNWRAALTGGAQGGYGFTPGLDVLGTNAAQRLAGTAATGLVRTHGMVGDINAAIGRGAAEATGATPEAAAKTGQQWAMRSGNYGTVGQTVSNALEGIKQTNPALDVAGQILLPFYRVGYNAMTQGIERSPVGLLGTAADVARAKLPAGAPAWLKGPYAAGNDASHVTPLAERLTNNLLGIGVAGLSLGAAAGGNLTGENPQGGAPKWSVRVGGQWVGLKYLGPAGESLAQAAALYEGARDGHGNIPLMAERVAEEYAGRVYDASWLRSVGDAIGMVGDVSHLASSYAPTAATSAKDLAYQGKSLALSFVPQATLGGQIKDAVSGPPRSAPVPATTRRSAPAPVGRRPTPRRP